MSLHDELKKLREVARSLNNAKFQVELPALKKFVDNLNILRDITPPEDFLLELKKKFLRGEENFSRRELKNLPFIIYEREVTLSGVKKILSQLNSFNKSHLRAAKCVYLLNHDASDKTELLRQKLLFFAQTFNDRRAAENLFGNERFANMTKLFAQRQSVSDVLKEIGLGDFYKASRFVHAALKNFFRTPNFPAQMKILAELDADPAAYKNIFAAAADSLIPAANERNFGKKDCLEIFCRQLGDPRFGLGSFNWSEVSQRAKEIFRHWLAEDDLETFFEIVKQTTNDKQWRYREKFWRKYLPRISNTWIFLARDARRYAAQSKLNHGILRNGNTNKAVFVFQIGRHIFSEWSNVGKVRAYTLEHGEKLFGRTEINGDFLRKNFVAEWIHSSPQSNFWQGQVDAWISRHC